MHFKEHKTAKGFVPKMTKKAIAAGEKPPAKKKKRGGESFRREQFPLPMLLQLLKCYGRATERMV